MKNKYLWVYFMIGLVFLAFLSIKPVMYGIPQLKNIVFNNDFERIAFVAETNVIPFAGVLISIIVSFLLFPIFYCRNAKLTSIISFMIGIVVFLAAEHMIEGYITQIGTAADYMMYRAPREVLIAAGIIAQTGEQIEHYQIPIHVKLHYYLFSIILILISIDFLYRLGRYICLSPGNEKRKNLFMQGIVLVLYACTYIFGAKVKYMGYDELIISRSSTITISICMIFASISIGLLMGNLTKFRLRYKWIPPISSLFTSILIYFGEYILLQGNFYRLGEGLLFNGVWLGLSTLDYVIIFVPFVVILSISRLLNRPY